MMMRSVLLLVLLGCTASNVVDPESRASERAGISSLESAIYGGAEEVGSEFVVTVMKFPDPASTRGQICTGTMLSDTVVLTAKHCLWNDGVEIPADRVTVRVGARTADAVDLDVREIRTTPGAYSADQIPMGVDIALLILDQPVAGATVAQWSASFPSVGQSADILGFGFRSDESNLVGVRYKGTTEVVEVTDWLIRTLGDSWTCQGDSGGPILVDNVVVGVTSAGRGGCRRDAEHWYTALAPHRALIESVVGGGPPACTPTTETCDSVDNDCDSMIDEGACMPGEDAGAPPPMGTDAGTTMPPTMPPGMSPTPRDDGGCQAGGSAVHAWFAMVLLLGWGRRRRI